MAWIGAIVSLVATAASTYAASSAAEQTQKAQNAAVQNQLDQQAAFEKKGQGIFNTALGESGVDQANQQITTGANRRSGLYDQLQSMPISSAGLNATPSNAINDVRTNQQRQLSNTSRAAVSGLSDWQLQQWLNNQNTASAIGVNNNLSQGAAGTLGLQLQNASHAGDNLAAMGNLGQNLGGLFGTYWGLNHPVQSTTLGLTNHN